MLGQLLGGLASGVMSLFGQSEANRQRTEGQNKEIELQKEFAQNGLRWKIEDAERAGVHPLAALGASGASYSPVGLGQNDTAAGFAAAGDSFHRAIDATATAGERATAYDKQVQGLQLTRMGLENELLMSQIAQINQAGRGPPFPVSSDTSSFPGEGNAPISIPTPFGMPALRVANPKLAQQAQDHFGEPLEWVYGGTNFLDSIARQVFEEGYKAADSTKERGLTPRGRYPVPK